MELSANKRSTDLEGQTIRVIGTKHTNIASGDPRETPWEVDGSHIIGLGEPYVRYELGSIGCCCVSVILPPGEPMTWDMIKKRIDETWQDRGGMPFVPNEMLAATGVDCSDW